MADLPSRTTTYGCDCLNDCGDDPRMVAGAVRRCDWGAHWKEVHERRQRMIDAAPALLAALQQTWEVIDAAGLSALTRGVELGPTVWFVKASEARENALAAIAEATGAARPQTDCPTVATRTVESLQRELLAIARGGKFAEAWSQVNGVQGSDGINLRAEISNRARIRDLRAQIAAIDPDAALYYGWADDGMDRDRDPAQMRVAANAAETMRLFGPKENT